MAVMFVLIKSLLQLQDPYNNIVRTCIEAMAVMFVL